MGSTGVSPFLVMLNRLWLSHSRTFAELSWSHSFDFLACCWGCCPAERWTVTPVWDQEHFGAGAHPGCLVSTMLHSSFPLSWLFSQFLLLKNMPTACCCCHHHASLQGWYGLMIDEYLFSPNMKSGIHTKMSVHQRSLFLVVWESGVFWTNSDMLPCGAAETVALLEGSPLATEDRYCTRLFGHLSGYGSSASFEGQPGLGQILMVPLCYLGTWKHQKRLSVPTGLCSINWRTLSTGLCLSQLN